MRFYYFFLVFFVYLQFLFFRDHLGRKIRFWHEDGDNNIWKQEDKLILLILLLSYKKKGLIFSFSRYGIPHTIKRTENNHTTRNSSYKKQKRVLFLDMASYRNQRLTRSNRPIKLGKFNYFFRFIWRPIKQSILQNAIVLQRIFVFLKFQIA